MHCSACGKEIKDGDKYCANCGAAQDKFNELPETNEPQEVQRHKTGWSWRRDWWIVALPIIIVLKLAIYSISSNLSSNESISDFKAEHKKITNAIGCPNPKITSATEKWGALYSCIGGRAETVKVFVNEDKGKVEDIKFMWNDWTKDHGDGVHTDSELAKVWLSKIARLYAQDYEEDVKAVFFSKKSQKIQTADYLLEYRYTKGPAIDERLYTITTREAADAKEKVIKRSAGKYEQCRQAIAKAVGYSFSHITGDGNPINESGYISFYFDGRGKDMFFCEVRSNDSIKIKAAMGGEYPFKYIK